MKKSKKPSVRIKRSVKSLSDANRRTDIGNVLLEHIIILGIVEVKRQLLEIDRSENHFISPSMWDHCIEILEEHLDIHVNN